MRSAKNAIFHIPKIIKKFNIKKLFDAPCGDFNWMCQLKKNIEIDYLGADIVEELISVNKKYENDKTKFIKLDIINEKLPEADLINYIASAIGCSGGLFLLPVPLLKFLGFCIGRSNKINQLIESLQLDIEQIRKTLIWSPQLGVQEGIRRVVQGK